MIKDPTKLATTIAAPATEIAIAVAVAVATTSTTAITAVTIKAVTIAIQGEGASPSLSLYSVGEKGVKLKRRRKTRISTKKNQRFDMSQVLKRYAKMVRPLMFFKGRKENLQSHRQPYSFSGNLSWRNKQELRGRRGEYSAPASMRTSPSNSGLLVATTTLPSSTSDSTMEELQAAIQAAIAHCKNSIATEEKIKC